MKYRKTNQAKRMSSGCRNNGTCKNCRDARMHSTLTRTQDQPQDIAAEADERDRMQAADVA